MIEKDGESLEKVKENVEDDEGSQEMVMENDDYCETMDQKVPTGLGQYTLYQHTQCQSTFWCQYSCCPPVS